MARTPSPWRRARQDRQRAGDTQPLEEEAIEQHLTARLARQSLLTRRSPYVVFSFILEEGALQRMVRGKAGEL